MKLFYFAKKEFIELFRQRELLPLIFVVPLIQIIILGYVVKTDIKHLPVEIINMSKNIHSRKIINRINATPLFKVRNIRRTYEDSQEILKRGKSKAVLVFRDSLSRKSALKSGFPEIQVLMDGVDSNTSAIAAGYLTGIIKKYVFSEFIQQGHSLPVEQKPLIRFNPRLESINYMGPGVVALILTLISLFLASISLVREKEQQTMDTLLISQLKPFQIYIGKAIPMTVIGLIQMSVAIATVVLWFDIPVRGNIIYLFLAALIFLAASLSFALFISTLANTQQQALFFSWFSIITFILLSGLFTPVENIPAGLRFLSDINPLRYLIKIIREIFLKGNGIGFFYQDLLILTAITLITVTISSLNFKRFISK